MMKYIKRIRIMDVLVLAFMLAAAWIALGYGARARMVPVIVAFGSAGFMIIQIALSMRGVNVGVSQEEMIGEKTLRAAEEAEAKEELLAREDAPRMIGITYEGGSLAGAIALVVGFTALIYLIGVVAAVFVFMLWFLIVNARMPILHALGLAVATEIVVYGLFIYTLGVRPNTGYLVSTFF